jgi:hypothetical protein
MPRLPDTKLARETKGNTVLQISLYSDLLSEAQKLAPEFAYVVTPGARSARKTARPTSWPNSAAA